MQQAEVKGGSRHLGVVYYGCKWELRVGYHWMQAEAEGGPQHLEGERCGLRGHVSDLDEPLRMQVGAE